MWHTILDDFPVLERQVHGRPLVYLDNAASSLTPRPVLEAMDAFYTRSRANVHRGLHALSMEATEAYEGARDRLVPFLNAPGRECIVFSRGATSSLNLVARSWGAKLGPGDVIVISRLEHHANLVPWQMTAQATGASLRFIELTDDGAFDLDCLEDVIRDDVKIVSVAHVSNVLGAVNPVEAVFEAAHAVGAVTVLDAAQSVGHMPVDFAAVGADFLAFSSHKMCGPTGLGVLCGKRELLDQMEPIEGGGDMIAHVDWERSTWNRLPYKLEAGTPPIAEGIGLKAAVDYLDRLGLEAIRSHTHTLTQEAVKALRALDGVTVYGPGEARLGPVAFNIEGVHPHDVATLFDGEGVAVRAGHHCAEPLHRWLGVPATARASFYLTNKREDIDRLVAAVGVVQEVFGHVV